VFDLSPEKVILLGIIALVVLGPHRLPQAARSAGQFVGNLRRMTSSLHSEVRDAIGEPMDAFTSAMGDLHPRSVSNGVRRAFTQSPTEAVPPPGVDPGNGQSPGSPPAAGTSVAPDPTTGFAGGFRTPDDPSLN
jgi:sec-independent protein translocase protein TatB